MENKTYDSIEELLATLKPTYGHKFKEYDVNGRLNDPKNKGRLGQIVEEGIFQYPINSRSEADFANLGIELKTTGVVINKNGSVRAKERLTLKVLNYNDVAIQDFAHSNVWSKSKSMLIVLYDYLRGMPYGEMPIISAFDFHFTDAEKKILQDDYNIIAGKIRAGKAETLSEGDTMYLGACTSGTGKPVPQPYSSTMAIERKFCLKSAFMTALVRRYLSNEKIESILSFKDLTNETFEEAILRRLSPYFGLTETEIATKFGIDTTAKNRYERYIAAMLGIKGKVDKTAEFMQANINLKTIRVNENGRIKESMSFPYFDFRDIVDQDWYDSDVRESFSSQKYLFAIYHQKDGQLVFERIQFWNLPENIIDHEFMGTYEKLQEVLRSGNIVASIDSRGIRHNNFPGMAENGICHIRPHGINKYDTCPLPVPDRLTGETEYTKQCFWLNNKYIANVISAHNTDKK
jgi:DNA mismatch repair protein MutH